MPQNLKTSLLPLVRNVQARPWAFFLGAIVICLAAYYLLLGVHYWQVAGRLSTLDRQSQTFAATLRNPAAQEEVLARLQVAQEQQSKDVKELFTYPETDQIAEALISVAREAGADPLSITAGEALPQVVGAVKYQAMPMTVTLQANMEALSLFLQDVSSRLPVASVSGFRISGLDGTPLAQVQLIIYLSPEAIPPKKSVANATPTSAK